MVVTATFLVLWMVCAFGAVTFVSLASSSATRLVLFVVGAAGSASAAWAWGTLDAPLVGMLAAATSALYLWRPAYGWVAIPAGGALAGLWPWLLQLGGLTTALLAAAYVITLAAAAFLSRAKSSFAPLQLQEDALLILLGGGLSLAVLPGILDGWQSAVTLNATSSPAGATDVPTWLLMAVVGSLALGGVHTVWSRR